MPQHDMVGQDIGSPPQNPVPKSTGRPPYQQDPFQTAQVQEGTGQAYTQSGLGFGVKKQQPAYTRDPFDTDRPYQPKYLGEEEDILEEFGTEEHYRQRDERDAPPPTEAPPAPETRLEEHARTGEVTTENIPDLYSLRPEEFEQYGYSEDNPPPGHARTEDGHWVNTMTPQGEQSIQDVINDPSAGLPPEPGLLEQGIDFAEGLAQPRQRLNAAGEVVTTSPGGAISAALPPGLGAVAALGGAISARNLDNIHQEYGEYDSEDGLGYIGRDSVGAGTPLAISEGFIPGTTVVSGNTELAIRNNPALDVNGDGQLNSNELRDAIAAREQVRIEQERQAELDRIAAEDRRLAEAARRAEEEAARQRAAELERQQRQAEEAARREAERQANLRAAEEALRRQESDDSQGRYVGGTAVTDSRGNPVRDSSGRIATTGGTWTEPRRDDNDSGGGGGGGDSCFSATAQFLMADDTFKEIKDIKVGDRMKHGGRVYGILQGDGQLEDWYTYKDVYVTGSHFVFEYGVWLPVEESYHAVPMDDKFDTWYCVLNENHVMVTPERAWFTDFDAVDSVNDELKERLNAVQE